METQLQEKRIISIDILRGIVMVIMALDHTRDYFTNYYNDPTDLQTASTAMFLTRWITHFCAPVFVFLAGTSAYLSLSKGRTKKESALFLLTRGLWLIILELTIVRFGWQFNIDYTQVFVQVIWAIGWSMIFLSVLIFLPRALMLTIGLLLIAGHNTLDTIHASSFGVHAVWWNILHEFGFIRFDGWSLMILYPLVPWVGVMATGYCFGALFRKPQEQRNKWFYTIGLSAILLFIVLRWTNVYGDANLWSQQPTWWRTVLSFINCSKYPPSLLYLLMTIGPAIAFLPLLEKTTNAASRFFTVYGRVPMFYYILHIYLLHTMALIGAWIKDIPFSYFIDNDKAFGPKPGWGFPLPYVYAYWVLAIILLYLPCRWFMYFKMNNRKWWLSYI